jgi:hypothetical protein
MWQKGVQRLADLFKSYIERSITCRKDGLIRKTAEIHPNTKTVIAMENARIAAATPPRMPAASGLIWSRELNPENGLFFLHIYLVCQI